MLYKAVQLLLRVLLISIIPQNFFPSSYGFRKLIKYIEFGKVTYHAGQKLYVVLSEIHDAY